MNQITQFLYWADVADKLVGMAGFWGVLASIIIIIGGFGLVVFGGIIAFWPDNDADKPCALRIFQFLRHVYIGIFCVGFLSGVIYAFIPGKQTLYAMAASQVGEQVINSEAVKGVTSDAYKALQAWIKTQIDPPKTSKN